MGLLNWLLRLLGVTPPQPRAAHEVRTAAPERRQRKSDDLARLDASRFAPLSDADVQRQARGVGLLWTNPWFGRRDLIPPAEDRRTLLIDRGMVGRGLITPEELAEIHEIGADMDRIRPDLLLAGTMADAAVQRSQEEREAIKQQKKAEAAERKRKHVEAVTRRRATDIIYLGRGVSKGLADRRANVEKLAQQNLPVLATPADLAEALGVSIPRLRWLAFDNPAATRTHYIRFSVPKKNGGTRELAAPHRDLARCQEWILQNILNKLTAHDAAHGFVPGRSTVTGATPHAGSEIVVNCDLQEFFPTITFPRVKGAFQQLGYSPAAATILALLCTESPRRTVEYAGKTYHVARSPRALPQGACTSPALSNLIARRLDSRLSGIAAKLGWRYTRYADDLTFSLPLSDDRDGEAQAEPPVAEDGPAVASPSRSEQVGYLLARVRHIAADEGFQVNETKTRVQRRNRAQLVTGIVVNDRPGVPRDLVRRLRAILHRAESEGLPAQNRENHPNFEEWLRGMIAYVQMVNPRQGEPLREALDALPDATSDPAA